MTTSLERIVPVVRLAASLGAATACRGDNTGQSSSPGQQAQQVITADGSSTVFPVTEAVAEEFQKANRGARVTVGSSGTGGGFEKVCRNETAISNPSPPVKGTGID